VDDDHMNVDPTQLRTGAQPGYGARRNIAPSA
jgi:hypothetical protein